MKITELPIITCWKKEAIPKNLRRALKIDPLAVNIITNKRMRHGESVIGRWATWVYGGHRICRIVSNPEGFCFETLDPEQVEVNGEDRSI